MLTNDHTKNGAGMKILVVTSSDANNFSIENIVRELQKRGHQIQAYGRILSERAVRPFREMGITVQPQADLTPAVISQFDIALCGNDSMAALRFADIYVFSYNVVMGTWVSEGADFMFTFVKDRHLLCDEDCATMPIGSTKNDADRAETAPERQFLFIDAGHNPFGEKAKLRVAHMLLDVCRAFPSYKLVIKPRWLPEERTGQSHRSSIHLYDLLEQESGGHLPDNLVMLREHRNMQQLIDESVCAITTSISSFWDVVLRGRGCIVVDGLDGEEQFETRTAFASEYEEARKAGLCADHQDVVKFLPAGLHCAEGYIQERVAYTENVSSRAADVIEYVYENYVRNGQYPAIQKYDYEDYKEKMTADPGLTLKELKYKRLKNSMLYQTRNWQWLKTDIDHDGFFELLESCYHTYPLTADGYRALLDRMNEKSRSIILENREKCMADPIDQAIYFQTCFDAKREDLIWDVPEKDVKCVGSYHYYLGRSSSKNNQPQAALEHYSIYLDEVNARSFNKYPQDRDEDIRVAYNYILANYDKENLPASEFAKLYICLYEQRDPAITEYRWRKRAYGLMPGVAEMLADSDPAAAFKCLQLYAKWEYFYNCRERDAKIRQLQKQLDAVHRSPLYRCKRLIGAVFKKIKGGILCLREHGWRYTWDDGVGQIKDTVGRRLKKQAAYKIWNLFRTRVMAGYSLYARLVCQYGEDAEILVSAPATGDAYIFGQYVKAYADNMLPGRRPVYIVYGQTSLDVAKLFGIESAEARAWDEFNQLYSLTMFAGRTGIHAISMQGHILYYHIGIVRNMFGIHGFHLGSLLSAYLGLDEDAAEQCAFPQDQEGTDELFCRYGMQKGRTVLLAPYAKSCKPVSIGFWEKLAKRLNEMGITVCTNSVGDREGPISGTRAVFIPYIYSVPFLNEAGACIGLRSGFSDVTNSAKCLKVTVYPEENYMYNFHTGCNDVYSLTSMYKQPNQYELLWSPERETGLIDDIVQLISETLGLNDEEA